MPEPYDVTQEVWCVLKPDEEDRAEHIREIAVERRAADGTADPQPRSYILEPILTARLEAPDPDETEMARLTMAARAPTFYRLLEQVVTSGGIPADLEEVIRINLARAAPKVYRMPDLERPERKSAWQKLLDDDLG